MFTTRLSEPSTAGANCRALLAAGAMLACLNLALGLFLALWQPYRATDFLTVYGWCRQWLQGIPLYASDTPPDYPPNAIVTYAVLTLVPAKWMIPVWAIISLTAALLIPFVALRALSQRHSFVPVLVATVMFLCWGGTWTLLQFTKVSFLLALLALALPERGIVGGVSMGLALAKPHIAGPLALWAVCRGRGRLSTVAAVVVAIQIGVYCLHRGVGPAQPLLGWLGSLGDTYAGSNGLNGYTSVRPWLVAALGHSGAADVLWMAVAALGLLVLGVAAARDRTKTPAIPGLLCLWSLLTIYHNLNNLLLMLPAMLFLLAARDPETDLLRRWTAIVVQVALMLNVPVQLSPGPRWPLLRSAVAEIDRVVVLGTFFVMAWCWWRLQRLPIEQTLPPAAAAHGAVALRRLAGG